MSYELNYSGAEINEALYKALNPQTTPASGSDALITSGSVYVALGAKQDTLTFDDAPTQSSTNPVTSGGIYTALGGVKGIYPCTTSTSFAQINAALSAGKLPVLIETVEGYTIAFVYSNGGPAGHQFVQAGWSEYFSDGSLVWGGLSVSMMICSSASVWTQKEVIPVIAAQNGTYTLKATKTSSGVTYSWVADT